MATDEKQVLGETEKKQREADLEVLKKKAARYFVLNSREATVKKEKEKLRKEVMLLTKTLGTERFVEVENGLQRLKAREVAVGSLIAAVNFSYPTAATFHDDIAMVVVHKIEDEFLKARCTRLVPNAEAILEAVAQDLIQVPEGLTLTSWKEPTENLTVKRAVEE